MKRTITDLVRRLDQGTQSRRKSARDAFAGEIDPMNPQTSQLLEVSNMASGIVSERVDPDARTIPLEFSDRDAWPEKGYATVGGELLYYGATIKAGPGLTRHVSLEYDGTDREHNFDLPGAIVTAGITGPAAGEGPPSDFIRPGERATCFGRLIISDASGSTSDNDGSLNSKTKNIWFKVNTDAKWEFMPAADGPRPDVGAFIIDTSRGVVTVPPFLQPWSFQGEVSSVKNGSISIGVNTAKAANEIDVFITGKRQFTNYSSSTGQPGPILVNGTMLRHDGYYVNDEKQSAKIFNVRQLDGFSGNALPDLRGVSVQQPEPSFRANITIEDAAWRLDSIKDGLPFEGECIVYAAQPGIPTTENSLWIGRLTRAGDHYVFQNITRLETRPGNTVTTVTTGAEAIVYQSTSGKSISQNAPSSLDRIKLDIWYEQVSLEDPTELPVYTQEPVRGGKSNFTFAIGASSGTSHKLPYSLLVTNAILGNVNDDGQLNGIVDFGTKLTMTGKLLLSLGRRYVAVLPKPLSSTDLVNPDDAGDGTVGDERPELIRDGISPRIFDYISAENRVEDVLLRVQLEKSVNGVVSYYDLPCHAFVPDNTGKTGGSLILAAAVDPTLPYHFRGQVILAYQFIDRMSGSPIDLGTDEQGLFLGSSTDELRFNQLTTDEQYDWKQEKHFAIIGKTVVPEQVEYEVPFAIYDVTDVNLFTRALPQGYDIPQIGWQLDIESGTLLVPKVNGALPTDAMRVEVLRTTRLKLQNAPNNKTVTTALTDCVRSVNKVVRAHPKGTQIASNIVAQHHRSLANSVIAMQSAIGANNSNDRRSAEWMMSAMESIDFERDETEGIHASFAALDRTPADSGISSAIKVETVGRAENLEVVYDRDRRETIPLASPGGTGSSRGFSDKLRHTFSDVVEPVIFISGKKTELAITSPVKTSPELPSASIFSSVKQEPLPDSGGDVLSSAPEWIRLPTGETGIEIDIPGVGKQSLRLPNWADNKSDSVLTSTEDGILSEPNSPPIYDSEVFEVNANNRSAKQFSLKTKAVNYDDAHYVVYMRGLRLENYQFEITRTAEGGVLTLVLPEDELETGDTITVESVRLALGSDKLQESFDDKSGELSGSAGPIARQQIINELGDALVGTGVSISSSPNQNPLGSPAIPGSFRWGRDMQDRREDHEEVPSRRSPSRHSPGIPDPEPDAIGASAPEADRNDLSRSLTGEVTAPDTWASGRRSPLPSSAPVEPGPSNSGFQERDSPRVTDINETPDPSDPAFPDLPTL